MNDSEISIRDLVGMLHRQKWLICIVTLVFLGATLAWVLAIRPIYTAETLILVDPINKSLLESSADNPTAAAANTRIFTEVELIKSNATLLRVIETAGLISDKELGVQLGAFQSVLSFFGIAGQNLPTGETALRQVLGKLTKALDVRRKSGTNLINVRFSTFSATKAAELANKISQSYIDDQLATKIRNTLSRREILHTRIAAASANVTSSEQALDTFVLANAQRVAAETGNVLLSELSLRFQATERELITASDNYRQLETSLLAQDWSTLSEQLGFEAVAELERQRQAISGALEAQAGDAQREVDLRKALADIERMIATQVEQELDRVSGTLSGAQAQSLELQRQIRVATVSSNLPADLVTQIYRLQQNASVSRTQYQTLLARLREVEAEADLQIADSRIISPALPPARPSFPNAQMMFALAGIIGLGFGIGFAVLNERYVGGFTSVAQAETLLNPTLAVSVPKLPSSSLSTDAVVPDAIPDAPLSAYSESLRRLRAGIDQSLLRRARQGWEKQSPGNIILVGSAGPSEGKSSVALSLARTYAISGQRTLLIDADMRHPSIHALLGEPPSHGLVDHLMRKNGGGTLADGIITDNHSELQILLGGRQEDVVTDHLLAGKRFVALMESATKHFDVVVLDTSPIGSVTDALFLAPFADFMVFVVKWASTSQSDVYAAIKDFRQAAPEGTQFAVALNQHVISAKKYRPDYQVYEVS